MEKYRRKALELVSVSGAEYEKLKAENARVLEIAANKDPGTPLGTTLPSFAAIQGSIDRRLQLWNQLVHSYAHMYQQNPMLNKFCLLVAIASATVLLPGIRHAVVILRQRDLPAELRRVLESWVTCFFTANFAIYQDIYSAHLAFHASDENALAELPGYYQQLLPLWTRAKKERCERNAIDANRLFVDRAEEEVGTPIFLLFPEGMKFITSTGKMQWPRLFKDQALKADLNPYWPDPSASFAPVEPKTTWLRQSYDVFLRWLEKSDDGVEKFFQSMNASKL